MKTNILYQGDNLEIMREMPDASIDLIYADPPFNTGKVVNGKYMRRDTGNNVSYLDKSDYRRPTNSFSNMCQEWHDRNKDSEWYFLSEFCSPSELYYYETMLPIITALKRLLKKGGALYWHVDFRTSYIYRIIINRIFGDRGCFRNQITWYYPNKTPLPGLKHRFSNNYDSILYYSVLADQKFVGKHHLENEYGTKKKMGCVWTIPFCKKKARTGYPTQKPLALLYRIIKASSNEGDIVLDPFCGSGTTCVAANNLGRYYIGIDQNPDAIRIAEGRLAQLNLFTEQGAKIT